MRRRVFIGMAAAAAAPWAWPRLATGQSVKRAAAVIGIDQCEGLPRLRAAVSGAHQMTRWLREEGFTVKEFLDDSGRVTASQIYDGIEELLRLPGGLDQLLVYFSGHGFLVSNSEHWLLSKAPGNPNESILLPESVVLARRCGVHNVVFISDACRSTSDSLGAQGLHGQLIFPQTNSAGSGDVNVDQFFAALPGGYALEVPVDKAAQRFQGIYTNAFLSAYRRPDGSMVKSVSGVNVVPNRLLRDYLVREVRSRAEAVSLKLTQQPEARVESDESAYIGRAQRATPHGDLAGAWPRYPAPPPPTPTLADVAGYSLQSAGLGRMAPTDVTENDVVELSRTSGFATARTAILSASAPDANVPRRFETGTGFLVWGAIVTQAFSDQPGARVAILRPGDGKADAAIVRLERRPATIGVRFPDGSGTVVAALPDYIATLVVQDNRVQDVSYLPSQFGPFAGDDATMRRLNELRAAVAASAQYGVFRIEGTARERRDKGVELADRIRMDKAIDPTLGLYAAYAYADAGLRNEVESVREYMRGSVQGDLFDVAMLAATLWARAWQPDFSTRPLCPLLTQGWSFLRVSGAKLPGEILEARSYLSDALWTSFQPKGMDLMERVVRRGR